MRPQFHHAAGSRSSERACYLLPERSRCLPAHVAGALAPGDLAHDPRWYCAAVAFCNPSTFNLTNAFGVI